MDTEDEDVALPHCQKVCQDLKTNTDQYEHPQLARAVWVGFFWDADAIGMAFSAQFNLIPVPAVALILTMMQVCIAKWELGYHKALELDIHTQQADYEHHLLGLYEYKKSARNRLAQFQGQWFEEA
ncbi:hypothetical protein FS749_001737, partial [Ceratobasidium sp. UAMH 11750]